VNLVLRRDKDEGAESLTGIAPFFLSYWDDIFIQYPENNDDHNNRSVPLTP